MMLHVSYSLDSTYPEFVHLSIIDLFYWAKLELLEHEQLTFRLNHLGFLESPAFHSMLLLEIRFGLWGANNWCVLSKVGKH